MNTNEKIVQENIENVDKIIEKELQLPNKDLNKINVLKQLKDVILLMKKEGLFEKGIELNQMMINRIIKNIEKGAIFIIDNNVLSNKLCVLRDNPPHEGQMLHLEDITKHYEKPNIYESPNHQIISENSTSILRKVGEKHIYDKENYYNYDLLGFNKEVVCKSDKISEKELTEMKNEFTLSGISISPDDKYSYPLYGVGRIIMPPTEEIKVNKFANKKNGEESISINKPIIKANMNQNGDVRFSIINRDEEKQIAEILQKGGNKNDILKNEISNYLNYNEKRIQKINEHREELKRENSNKHSHIREAIIKTLTEQIRNLSNMNYVVKEQYKNILALDINRPAEQKAKEISLDLDLRISKNETQSESTKKQEQKLMYAPKKNNINKKGINI